MPIPSTTLKSGESADKSFVYRVWAPGRPDGGNDENCVAMKTTAGLDDNDCPTAHPYTCECDGKAAVP